jgi:AdoMet-dependent heme synthase
VTHDPNLRHVRYDLGQRPFIVIWEVTRACALACLHCRAEAIPDRSPVELTHDEGRRLLDEIASFGPPSPLLVLTGGDPFERPDLEQLVTEATQRGIPVSLAPSVTPLLTLEALRRLRAAGVRAVSLSLDGASPVVHDGFRGIPGVFDRTLEAARWVREAGCRLQINTTVTARSLPELADVLAIVLELDTTLWSIFLLVPTGRGEAIALPTAEETEDLLHFLHDAGQHISVKATEAPHFRRVVAERGEGRGRPTGPVYRRLRERLDELLPAPPRETVRRPPLDVNAGRGFVFVSHTGVVQPSGFFPLAAGSVRERSLPEIYRHSPLLRALRDPARLRGVCGACGYAETCGGSRSRAYAVSGDPFADEPTCLLTAPTLTDSAFTPDRVRIGTDAS